MLNVKKVNGMKVIVIGDYFLDRYIYLDSSCSEISPYTYTLASQVVNEYVAPGAAGTVAKNLRYLGVGEVYALGICGDDGAGYELNKSLKKMGISCEHLIREKNITTPEYIMLMKNDTGQYIESGEIHKKNRKVISSKIENKIIKSFIELIDDVRPDAVICLDQISEKNGGVLTKNVRLLLNKYAYEHPEILFYVDSRTNLDCYENMILKCNEDEFSRTKKYSKEYSVQENLANYKDSHIIQIVTIGEKGVLLSECGKVYKKEAVPVYGEIDTRGAGDAFTSAFVVGVLGGCDMRKAMEYGVASSSKCVTTIAGTGKITLEELIGIVKGEWCA